MSSLNRIHPVRLTYRHVLRAAVLSASLLTIPLLGSRYADGWNWSARDYIAAAALLFGAALIYELIVAQAGSLAYRLGAGLAVVTALALVWVNLAVGVIGEPNHPANLVYAGVLLLGTISAYTVRLRPRGMARTLFAMAAAMALVAIIVVATLPQSSPGVPAILFAHGIFAALFMIAGLLFRRAGSQLSTPCP